MAKNDTSPRLTGALFLLFIVMSAVHYGIIEQGLIFGAPQAIRFIEEKETLFRFGILLDLALFLAIVLLAAMLYSLLKPYSRSLAMTGLLCLVIQAPVSVGIELSSFAAMWIAKQPASGAVGQGELLLELILNLRAQGYVVVILFFAVGYTCFFLAFLRSGLVPRFLSLAGVVLSLVFLVTTSAQVLSPGQTVQNISMAVSGIVMLHQVVFGGWLVFKGTFAVHAATSGRVVTSEE